MRILFEEMVLDLPGVVIAEPVGQFDLIERVLIQLQLAAGLPWARQLQLVENAEFHSHDPYGGRRMMPARRMHYNGVAEAVLAPSPPSGAERAGVRWGIPERVPTSPPHPPIADAMGPSLSPFRAEREICARPARGRLG